MRFCKVPFGDSMGQESKKGENTEYGVKDVLFSFVVIVVSFVSRNLFTHSVLHNFLVTFGLKDIYLYLCTQKCLNENKYDNGKRLL